MTAAFHGADDPGHPAPHAGAVPLPILWFGLFGAPAAWAVQLIANYALDAHFCYPTTTPRLSPTFGGVRAVSLVASAVLLLVALAALGSAIRAWKRTPGEGRVRFMALAGILVSGIFVFGVLMNSLPLITMPVCTY